MKSENILLTGSGGREHTLAWKLAQSPLCNQLYIAPGNGGTREHGINLEISATDFNALKDAALSNQISLIIVGPEEPLVKGFVDFFKNDPSTAHIKIIGPAKEAAQLEGSKAFSKSFLNKYNIPTAAYKEFTAENYNEGIDYIRKHDLPIVLKADGLAAGKGVLICHNHLEALAEFELMILQAKFGVSGNKVVIEEFLEGMEMSAFILTNGKEFILLPEAKDYKRIGENDKGLNTGGMGAVSPVPFYNEALQQKVLTTIIQPTIDGLQKEKLDYNGFIFFGLMIRENEPMVIEYNCRLGDPETEVILPRIKNDLVELLLAVFDKNFACVKIDIDERSAATVVAVSGGYPGLFRTGIEIHGIDSIRPEETLIFHSGTLYDNGKLITNGGRVLAATSLGENIREAAEISTYNLEQIYFEDIYFRGDIGYEFRNAY